MFALYEDNKVADEMIKITPWNQKNIYNSQNHNSTQKFLCDSLDIWASTYSTAADPSSWATCYSRPSLTCTGLAIICCHLWKILILCDALISLNIKPSIGYLRRSTFLCKWFGPKDSVPSLGQPMALQVWVCVVSQPFAQAHILHTPLRRQTLFFPVCILSLCALCGNEFPNWKQTPIKQK